MWPAVSLSDMARLALVWHVGGVYSDADVVCIAPLTNLRNVLALQDTNVVNNAVFHSDRHGDFLDAVMTYLSKNFRVRVSVTTSFQLTVKHKTMVVG